MKSENCISHTGLIPTTAAPTAVPMIADSASGVSITRASPNSSKNPSVTLNAPPKAPMSSPITNTRSSARISSRSPSEIACRYVISDIARLRKAAPRRVTVAERLGLALAEHALERARRIGHLHRQRLLRSGVDLSCHLRAQRRHVHAQRRHTLLLAIDR